MTSISLKFDTSKARKQIKGIKDQTPFAIRLTVNALAQTSKKEMDKQILQRVDRPTPYTKRAIFVKSAKSKTDPTARIDVKNRGTATKRGGRTHEDIIGHLFTGGQRQRKGIEMLFQRAGLLRADEYIVPGAAAPLDQFGNVKRSFLIQLISYFRAFNESGFKANADSKGRLRQNRAFARSIKGASAAAFFVVTDRKGKLVPGIWARVSFSIGSAVKPILIFAKKPKYRQMFRMDKTVKTIVDRDANKEFEKAYNRAISTARPNN